MTATLIVLALAAAVFLWAFAPLFGAPREIVQTRSQEEALAAVSRSVQELRTDLELDKLHPDDLEHIQAFLQQESSD